MFCSGLIKLLKILQNRLNLVAMFRGDHEHRNGAVGRKAAIFCNRHSHSVGLKMGGKVKIEENIDQAACAAEGVDVLDIL